MPKDQLITNRFVQIDALITNGQNWSLVDIRIDAHIASYVCVLLSGTIESAIERLMSLRVQHLGDREIEHYVTKVVGERFRNPDWHAITRLLRDVDETYRNAWRLQFPYNGQVAQSLQSINNVKNDLAHEGASSLHVTLRDTRHYLSDAITAVDYLETLLT